MPPVPITAPVLSLPPEPHGGLSLQPLIPGVGHPPSGSPRERSLKVTTFSFLLG